MASITITKKQTKATLSGKKKRPEVIKNLLVKPYKTYWPLLSPENLSQLKETLEKTLPLIVPPKKVIPYNIIKAIPKEERKKYRQSLYSERGDEDSLEQQKYLIFGVNAVTKALECDEVGSVLIEGEVQPRLLVQHVLDQAVLNQVPVLVVSELKNLCRKHCGICGAVIAIRKTVKDGSKLGLLQQTIGEIFEGYPVPREHVNAQRGFNPNLSAITISDSEGQESVSVGVDLHLVRSSKKRVFVPDGEVDRGEVVSLGGGADAGDGEAVGYLPLSVKRVKGNKDRSKRKLAKVKSKN